MDQGIISIEDQSDEWTERTTTAAKFIEKILLNICFLFLEERHENVSRL